MLDILSTIYDVRLEGELESFFVGGNFVHLKGLAVEHYCCTCKQAPKSKGSIFIHQVLLTYRNTGEDH